MSRANGQANGKPKVPGKKRGPKSKLTPKLIRRVMRLASDGLSQNQIALIVGISPVTICDYKKKSPKFLNAINTGLERGVMQRLARIRQAAVNGAWQADAWWLERVKKDQFGRHVEVTGAGGGPIATSVQLYLPQKQEAAVVDVESNIVELPEKSGGGNGG